MLQRKSGCRWGQAWPAFFVIGKSAETENVDATQHRAKHLSQSARRLRRPPSEADSASVCFSDNVCHLLSWSVASIPEMCQKCDESQAFVGVSLKYLSSHIR